MRLQIFFSDNRTRLSNPFAVSAMRNIYSVKVGEIDMVVTRNPVLSNNAILGLFLSMIPITLAGQLILAGGLLGSNLFIEQRNRNSKLPFKTIPGRYLLAWVLIALTLVGGTFFTWALPLTVLIELMVAYIYYRYFWLAKGLQHQGRYAASMSQRYTLENRPPSAASPYLSCYG